MKNIRAIVLAAGKGTRMISEIPKVMHPICGKPMLQYVLDIARDAGSLKTYVVVGHKSQWVKGYLPKDCVAVEQPKLLGTADAVRRVENRLRGFRGDVLILCGDTPLLKKGIIKDLLRKHKNSKAAGTFLTTVVHDPFGYGRVIRDEKKNVAAIREEKDAVGYEKDIAEINVGVYCFQSRELFGALKEIKLNAKKREFYLTDIIELFAQKNLVIKTIETEDAAEGQGINTREDLARAEALMRQRILKDFMLQGVTIIDPSTTFIDENVKIGVDTVVQPFTYIEKDVRIGHHCRIGPFARLRMGTRLGNHVEIGNFTEVSRAKVGDKTLMKHFSFIGDALVGPRVNIGAGVITANFDGKDKNTTRIAANSFIGSNTVLVAPVKIGKRVMVGAGSVVTRGRTIPDNSVVYGVPAKIVSRVQSHR